MDRTNRLTPAAMAALLIALGLAALTTVAFAAHPESNGPRMPQQDFELRLYMSDSENGPAQRSFVSSTTGVYAVVAYENAPSQRYNVRLRDLSGIEVYNESVTLDGTGSASKHIAIQDFVSSYEAHAEEQTTALEEGSAELENLCQSPPTPPVPTQPPPNPTPGPSPTPSGWVRWQALMLDALESTGTAASALDRTLQATASLPDAAMLAQMIQDIQSAQQSANAAVVKLEQAQRKVNPPTGTGPGTPTPEPPPQPDPAGACALVAEARADTQNAVDKTRAAMAAIPEDISTWRLPPTTARYDEGQFSSCLQYGTDLVQDSFIAASTPWTVGDAGDPALIFPAPELVDRVSLGQLRLRLPEGASAIYAQTVDVPDVNREAGIGAFVTDAMCNPVSGVTMTLSVDPGVAGSVAPEVADVVDGVATARLTSGTTPTLNSAVTGLVCVGPCGGHTGGRPPIVGRTLFSVTGPPHMLLFHVNPDVINTVKGERANVSVEVKDYYNRKVADGTGIHVRIAPGDPGVLARTVTPRGSRDAEFELLGKEVDLVTRNGFTIVPPGDDPGLVYGLELYLIAGDDGSGPVELEASWNGVTAEPALVTIVSRRLIFLPVVMRGYDVLATPPYSTTPSALESAVNKVATPAP